MTDICSADTRYTFTFQFLMGAAFHTCRAHEIERGTLEPPEQLIVEHRACVVSAVVQSALALEAEAWEVCKYGPNHMGGTSTITETERSQLAAIPDKMGTIHKYKKAVRILGKEPLPGNVTRQHTRVLLKLRDALVHYKSLWDSEMSQRQWLLQSLKQLNLEKPPFVHPSQNFFPHHCLNASLASWAVRTTQAFIREFFRHLQVDNPLSAYEQRLLVPNPKTITCNGGQA